MMPLDVANPDFPGHMLGFVKFILFDGSKFDPADQKGGGIDARGNDLHRDH